MRRFLRLGPLLLAIAVLPGCVVGILVADPPSTPRSAQLLKLNNLPVYFSVNDALSGSGTPTASLDVERAKLALRRVLVTEHGALVQEAQPPANSPYVYYRLKVLPTVRESSGEEVSGAISMFTFSIVPGYYSRMYPLDVFVEVSQPPAPPVSKWYRYEMKLRAFLWLPFIVAPDVYFAFVAGGEMGSDLQEGTEGVVRRLVYDTGTMVQGATPAGAAARSAK